MEIKKNRREFTLIALGLLIMVTPFVLFGPISVWVEIVLGLAVVIIGAWFLIAKCKKEKNTS